MERGATAVDGSTVYVTPGDTHRVWAYDLKEDKWTELPDCPQKNAGLAVVNGLLTAVGGMTNDSDATNTLVSLTESHSKWTEHFPPMPVKVYDPAVVCFGSHLVVVASMQRKVHVMDTSSLRWFCASSLPVDLLLNISLTVCGTELYMYVLDCMTSIFSCSLPTLLQSSSAVQPETTDVWRRLADVPVDDSTLTTLCGQLVAAQSESVDSIHLYNLSKKSWHIVGHMPTARSNCLVSTVGETLVVIGGVTIGEDCDIVEVVYPM